MKMQKRLLTGDRDKLTQLFLNLFLNSIQAMTGGGRLTVTTRHDERRKYGRGRRQWHGC